MKIGIDLLWVRPGICGGTESYIRNLMNGFAKYDSQNEYILFVTRDNAYSFEEYQRYASMQLVECPTVCASQVKRIYWENLYLDKTAKAQGVDLMFIPVYSKPRTFGSKIPYISVIHDLQGLHYPQYFSLMRRMFFVYMWRYACNTSQRVIVISEYGKKDLIAHFPKAKNKCTVIYNPVETNPPTLQNGAMEEKYGITAGKYFYCVSSMLPHKNLDTLLKTIALLKKNGMDLSLVISGVGGDKETFHIAVKAYGISENVIDTGFVSNEERDWLYENCRLFLFPSVFEGFGMPPIEAMRHGKTVVMTRESCLEEVTKGKAVYVDDPYSEEEWVEKIEQVLQAKSEQLPEKEDFPEYEIQNVVKEYLQVFAEVGN